MTSSIPGSGRAKLRGFGAVLTGLTFGLAGCLFGLHKLADVMLKHVVTPDASLAFQEVSDALPVPRQLDWNVPVIQALNAFRELRGPTLTVLAALLLTLLGAGFVLIVLHDSNLPRAADELLHPPNEVILEDGTPAGNYASEPKPQDGAPAGSTPRQASIVVPIGAALEEAPGVEVGEAALPAASGGDPGPQADPRVPSAPAPRRMAPAPPRRRFLWLLPALLYAVAAALLVLFGAPSVSDIVLRYYHTLGTFHQGYFQRIAVPSMAACVALWSGAGLALYALCVAGSRAAPRALVAASATILFVVAAMCIAAIPAKTVVPERDWAPAILTTVPRRSRLGVPDGIDAAQILAKQAGLQYGTQPEQPARLLVMMTPTGPIVMVQEGMTEDGLTASLASAKMARDFLVRRHYESALSWEAVKHIYGVATVHFDTSAAIETCLVDMENCPHLAQCARTARTMLFTCSASPANLALLDRWADERHFVHPARDSRRTMGQLYERMGQPQKALAWYRRADMPKSFLKRVENEIPVFHAGRIFGRMTLNGKPLTGIQVGVAPLRLNGLPPDMEPDVLRARGEIAAFFPQRRFPQYHPVPYSLRWISASCLTDSDGHFELSDLTEGEYTLVYTLPPSVRLEPPLDPRLTVTNPPPGLNLRYKVPAQDLGTIGLNIRP